MVKGRLGTNEALIVNRTVIENGTILYGSNVHSNGTVHVNEARIHGNDLLVNATLVFEETLVE